MTSKLTEFSIPDHRKPGAGPMKPIPVKLPADCYDTLQEYSKELGCFPSVLARTLIINGLNQLKSK